MKQLWINGEYIDVTDEIYTVYLKGQRKMSCFEKDLKSERVIKDKNGDIKKIIPSRENSLDRLLSDNIRQLSNDEWFIIKMLFYDELSERDIAKFLGISQVAVNKRKHRILKKLKKIINR